MFALSGQKWGNSVAGDPSGPVYWSVDFEGDLDFDSDRYSEQDFEDTLREAFQTWEDVSGLDLEQADASNPADITVGTQFLAGSTVGQASSSFRNTGGELGEYTSSRITFDTEVEWSPEGGAGTVDFFAVALHEIGHSIGLGHVNDPTQILNPVISTDELGDGDIEGVQALYGANADAPDPDPEPTPDPEPEPTPDPEPEPDPEPTPVPEPEPEPAPEPDSEDEADPDVTEAPVAEDDGGSSATGVIVGAAAIAGLGAAGAFSGLLAGGLGVAGIAVIGVGLGVVLVASGGGGDDAPAEGDEETSLVTQDATVEDAAGLALIDSLDDPEEEFDLSEMPTIPVPDEFCLTCGFETCSGCGQDEEESSDFLV